MYIIYIYVYIYIEIYIKSTKVEKQMNKYYNNRVPGAAEGGGGKVVSAISVDTLRGKEKGDPQH